MMNHKSECRPAAQRPVETVLDDELTSDLKPCPFCLSDFLSVGENSHNENCVFCHKCFCVGPSAKTKKIAKEYWNSRGEVDFNIFYKRDYFIDRNV